jgi:hypothetical protein
MSFENSFALGFGTETDVRDCNGELVISHDMPNSKSMNLNEFFKIYNKYEKKFTLAINIKSDGLQDQLMMCLNSYQIENYFLFDMAVPDALIYIRKGAPTFTRQSEYETKPAYYELSSGVWLDEFNGHWINEETIYRHLEKGKKICIVSPELHQRTYKEEWLHYREIEKKIGRGKLTLCTDLPLEAMEFFNE